MNSSRLRRLGPGRHHTYIILLPCGFVLLVTLADGAFLLLDRCQVPLDDVVQIFADRILYADLIGDDFRRDGLFQAG